MPAHARRTFVVGNWKMHKTLTDAIAYIELFLKCVRNKEVEAGLAVPYTVIDSVARLLKSTSILVGAQNMHDAGEGAFTGEIAAEMLVDAGAKFVLLGHSERRHLFGEDDAFINRKVKRALDAGLLPVVCIGETLRQRENGETASVLSEQMEMSLAGLTPQHLGSIVLAYEPVWAIGTGKTATPDQAQNEHAYCRKFIAHKWGQEVASKLRILYGGSVKPDNAGSLIQQCDVDGLLVGGSSLDPKAFCEIVNICK